MKDKLLQTILEIDNKGPKLFLKSLKKRYRDIIALYKYEDDDLQYCIDMGITKTLNGFDLSKGLDHGLVYTFCFTSIKNVFLKIVDGDATKKRDGQRYSNKSLNDLIDLDGFDNKINKSFLEELQDRSVDIQEELEVADEIADFKRHLKSLQDKRLLGKSDRFNYVGLFEAMLDDVDLEVMTKKFIGKGKAPKNIHNKIKILKKVFKNYYFKK